MTAIPTNVLVVGQVPPPVNGQSAMIEAWTKAEYDSLRLHHVRLGFSRTIGEVGKFRVRKLLILLRTFVSIVIARLRWAPQILYYPPAGPDLVPVLRDLFLLIGTRWMFQSTVFHFHAAGLPEIYPRLPNFLRPFYGAAYQNADLAIVTTNSTSWVACEIAAKAVAVVPYGISDCAKDTGFVRTSPDDSVPCILYVGVLCEGKGLITLVNACSLLHKAGIRFRVVCAGAFAPVGFCAEVKELLERKGLSEIFHFPGVLQNDEKWKAFRDADIFCFPSHYRAESFGVVLIEAMSFGLPIVTTNWRGIPDVVDRSGGAFIVEPKQPEKVAQKCETLLRDRELRKRMGERNRAWFCSHYTIEMYRANMEKALLGIQTR